MSKLVRAVFFSAYFSLIFYILKSFLTDQQKSYLEINYLLRTPGTLRKINRDIRKHGNHVIILPRFKRPERLPTDLKYILKWTDGFSQYSLIFKTGQQTFIENNCSYYNCYIATDRSLLTDPNFYDAILFDVENYWDTHPLFRVPEQKYIFMAAESADYYPICDPNLDSYYNWTWTYKLDSDIRWSFLSILDKTGKVVGPNINMSWITTPEPTPIEVRNILKTKKKAAAWFVSNCRSKNKREEVAGEILKSLAKYDLKIDIYGWCGKLTCPKDRIDECLELLRTDYYFYLAFENSDSDDYITEKILYPLQNYAVPIVYGGADYRRFLPPNSYINAGRLSADVVASLIYNATKNRTEYSNYFKWHNIYTYKAAPQETGLCVLCKMLHENTKNVSVVKNFRQWWNPNYRNICRKEVKNVVDGF